MKESLVKRVEEFGLSRFTTSCGQEAVGVEENGSVEEWVALKFKSDNCGGCSVTVDEHKRYIGAGVTASNCPYLSIHNEAPYEVLNIDQKGVDIYDPKDRVLNW